MAQITPKSPAAPLSPETLREQLLRPFPRISWKAIVIGLAIVGILSWSISGTQTSLTTLVDGLPQVWNFILRLLPPSFELKPGTVSTFLNGGTEYTAPIASAEAEIRAHYIPGGTDIIYIHDKDGVPISTLQRQLAQRISFLRADGLDTIRYVVGASGFTVGWPKVIDDIVVTLQMAVIGTIGAVLLALPFALLAAHNVSPSPIIYQTTRLILNTLRSVPELIYGLIFVAAVGLGPFAGVLAIMFGSVGSLSRLFAEALEQIDPQQVLALRATGAGGAQTFMYAMVPQALPLLISYSLVYFEHNVRNATIVGLVGAGGVGLTIFTYMSLFQYNYMLGATIILILAVTVIDRLSNYIRSRFI
ncbi:MAG: phosphonate ABC transporter, permease protein PhnE [Anaerolineae bacterium]